MASMILFITTLVENLVNRYPMENTKTKKTEDKKNNGKTFKKTSKHGFLNFCTSIFFQLSCSQCGNALLIQNFRTSLYNKHHNVIYPNHHSCFLKNSITDSLDLFLFFSLVFYFIHQTCISGISHVGSSFCYHIKKII